MIHLRQLYGDDAVHSTAIDWFLELEVNTLTLLSTFRVAYDESVFKRLLLHFGRFKCPITMEIPMDKRSDQSYLLKCLRKSFQNETEMVHDIGMDALLGSMSEAKTKVRVLL